MGIFILLCNIRQLYFIAKKCYCCLIDMNKQISAHILVAKIIAEVASKFFWLIKT